MCEQQVEQLVATITYRILWISYTNAETSIRTQEKHTHRMRVENEHD